MEGEIYMNNLMNNIKKLDIAKDDFSILNNENLSNITNELLDYYLIKKSYADSLVLEGEYVGITYKNLDIIKSRIKNR